MRRTAGALPHVMQVTYSLARGGSEQLAVAIARAGVERGFRMSICGLHSGGELEETLRSAGVDGHVIGRSPGMQPRIIGRLASLFRRERVNVVMTHHLGQLLYSAVGARLAGARLLHVEHEFYTLMSMKARRQLRTAGRLAERVVGVSDEVVRFLVDEVGLPATKVGLIRNGVDLSRFAPPAGRAPRPSGVPAGRPVVGTVGRLAPEKDHGTLIAAFGRIVASLPDAVLVIVGDGPARAEIESLVDRGGLRDSVRLLGDRFDVAALLPAIDVFVLSSVNEGLPLALLEALACARPVVVTDVGGVGGVVGKGEGGVLVPQRDPEAIARAVVGLLRDPAAAARMGAEGRRIVEERYDVTATIEAYLNLYRGSVPAAATMTPASSRIEG
jgi:glycosyltransferase involved in cell wall biosynthesis